ncbi:hypothetical protein PSPO01_11039 [Paraphaeosphaeria sporulosa]
MDRRERDDRDRDRRDDRYSNTYRPRSPGPRIDSYRANTRDRSPPRGGVSRADTYTPGGGRASRPRSRSPASFRRRSRSPRRDDDRWRAGRARSPPRRAYSPPPPPRRDDFRNDRARSPPRREYDSYTRSPRRDRSPPPRERDPSPARSRAARSPPRTGRYDEPRSRAQSPPRRFSPARDTRDYRRRSPSPRRERADPYTADTWRRRSPSPARNTYASNDASGRESAATSRRSSPPPVHPSRAALVPDDRPMRDPVSAPRSPFRERDFDRDRDYNRGRDRSRDRERERSPPRVRDGPPTGPRGDREREFAPPSGPSSSYRNGESNYSRAPPTGPRDRSYPSPAMSPPSGPSNSTPQPPAFPRTSSHNPVLAAPTRPRGGGRGSFGYDAPRRGSATWGARGGGYHGGPPSGPRGPGNGPTTFAPPFRGSSNSTSTTYPRTQRFGGHLDNLPKEITGGQKAPELVDTSKILKLEEEARKLREQIEAKEAAKRGSLREWDALGRDAENAALRSELAEQHLRSLNGDSEVGGAAF